MAKKTFTGDDIAAQLAAGDDVSIPGVGKLRVVDKAAREGRNPLTGASVTIAAHRTVKFSISSVLKKALNEK